MDIALILPGLAILAALLVWRGGRRTVPSVLLAGAGGALVAGCAATAIDGHLLGTAAGSAFGSASAEGPVSGFAAAHALAAGTMAVAILLSDRLARWSAPRRGASQEGG